MGESGSANYTVTFENGVQVFPCRCGGTHRGDYAEYEAGQHACTHDTRLLFFDDADDLGDAMCPLCGKWWDLRHAC